MWRTGRAGFRRADGSAPSPFTLVCKAEGLFLAPIYLETLG